MRGLAENSRQSRLTISIRSQGNDAVCAGDNVGGTIKKSLHKRVFMEENIDKYR